MADHTERLNDFATISRRGAAAPITRAAIERKCADARANPRGREIHVLHDGDADPLQRMINAMQPGTYVCPHRHFDPPKAEAVLVCSGSLAVLVFDDTGNIDWGLSVHAAATGPVIGADLRVGVWHTMVVLEPDTAIFEVKAGPYSPANDKDFAPWAPAYGDMAADAYLAGLETEARRRFNL